MTTGSVIGPYRTPGARYAVTTTGASGLAWRKDGKQVYVSSLSTAFTATATLTTGDRPPDFERTLVALTPDNPAPRAMTIMLDWTGALRR